METKQSKSRSARTSATGAVMQSQLEPVGEHKESELRGGIVLTARSLAMATREGAVELQASGARLHLVLELLRRDPKQVGAALQGIVKADGNKFALMVTKRVKGKIQYDDHGQPVKELRPVPEFVYWLVKDGGGKMDVDAARTRYGNVNTMRAAQTRGWKADETRGWDFNVKAAQTFMRKVRENDQGANAQLAINKQFAELRQQAGLPADRDETGKLIEFTPDQEETLAALYQEAKAQVEAKANAAKSGETAAERVAKRIIRDRGNDLAMKIAEKIEALIASAQPALAPAKQGEGKPKRQRRTATAH